MGRAIDRPAGPGGAFSNVDGMTGAASEPPGGWYPGSRLERIRDSHSYGFVLVLVAVSLVFAATASGGAWSGSVLLVLEAVTLVVAMWTSGVARADSRTSLVIVVVATGVAVANAVWAGTVLSAATGLLSAALVIVTGAVVGIGVADQRAVNTVLIHALRETLAVNRHLLRRLAEREEACGS